MSKKDFNPYRDMLDIPSLQNENPTDYQLLGVADFESDAEKIASAHEARMQRIAELYQLITKMSHQIDAARDRISDPQQKEEYDILLRKTGRAGVPHLGILGFLAVLCSFILSIVIVVVSTFIIYPRIVSIPKEDIGDSVTTLPNYNESQAEIEKDVPESQDDLSNMDLNNLSIKVDDESAVDFLDVPATDIHGEETTLEDLPVADFPLTDETPTVEDSAAPEESALENPVTEDQTIEQPAMEEPAMEEPAAEDKPAELEAPELEAPPLEAPAIEDSVMPEESSLPETPAVEESVTPEDSVVEQDQAPEVPDVPEVDQPEVESPAEPEDQTIERPDEESPAILVEPNLPEAPPVPEVRPDPDKPTAPKMSDLDNVGIPELPPIEEIASSNPPAAPQPPVIPELASVPEPVEPLQPQTIPEFTATSAPPETPSPNVTSTGVALEDVDKLDQFVQMGQTARTDADFAQLLSSARQTEEALMKEKQFQKAQQIADVVYDSCARFADKSYRAEAYQHKEIVSRRAAWWDSARAAEAKMQSTGSVSPAEANIVARWEIEIENDWETGLKYLALSENEQIQLAVKRDRAADPENVRHCLVVANDWWNLAQDPVPMQKQFRQRAGMWYAKALPSIADKQVRTLVEKRISMVDQGFSKH